ncbi:MAG: hypothetical protein AAF772_11600 [Acidobacteriota bacterium]
MTVSFTSRLRTVAAAAALTALVALPLTAATPAEIEAERTGIEPERATTLPTPDPVARAAARALLGTSGVLLIPESTNDRIMAFDPATGDLVDADFVPSDPTNLSTPIEAILSADGQSIFVSDQLEDAVLEYDLDGNFIGLFAPAGGVNTAILDNVRGIALSSVGRLAVSVGGGANADAIATFDDSGTFIGNLIANGAGGLASPFDVLLRTGTTTGYLVPGINSDNLLAYDLSGGFLNQVAPIDNFPEQVAEAANGNLLVANFGGSQEGVIELMPDGTVVNVLDDPGLGGYRGAYELANGNVLTTNGGGVHELDRTTGALVETKIAGVSARFITLAVSGPVEADLTLTKTADVSIASPGDTIVFTLDVSNAGPGTATNVTVVDTLPTDSVTYVSDTCGGTFVDPELTYVIPSLAPGASSCTVTVTVDEFATIVNTAVVSSDQTDPVPADNVGQVSVGSTVIIPTAGTYGLGALAMLIALGALFVLRRRF